MAWLVSKNSKKVGGGQLLVIYDALMKRFQENKRNVCFMTMCYALLGSIEKKSLCSVTENENVKN